jgi:hypothetical protein
MACCSYCDEEIGVDFVVYGGCFLHRFCFEAMEEELAAAEPQELDSLVFVFES